MDQLGHPLLIFPLPSQPLKAEILIFVSVMKDRSLVRRITLKKAYRFSVRSLF